MMGKTPKAMINVAIYSTAHKITIPLLAFWPSVDKPISIGKMMIPTKARKLESYYPQNFLQ